ncbi:MAG: hypothetical protein R6V13_06595 [Anaerolineae bacterium]
MIIILVVIVALVVLSALDRDRWPQSEEKGRTKRSPGARRLPPRRRTRHSPSILSFQGAREDSSSSARWWWE